MKSQSSNNLMFAEHVIKAVQESIYWKDINLVYQGCSDFMAKIAGFESGAAMVGKTDFDMPWADLAEEMQRNDRLVLQTQKAQVFQERGCDKDGNQLLVRSTKTPIFDDDGNIVGVLGISTDIQELTHAYHELVKEVEEQQNLTQAHSEFLSKTYEEISGQTLPANTSPAVMGRKIRSYLEDIICKLPANVFWRSLDGTYLGCNDQCAQFLGFKDRYEIIGQKNEDFLQAEVAEALVEADRQVLAHQGSLSFEEHAYSQQGKPVVWLSHKAAIRNEGGEPIGLLGVSFDITERKQMEAELKIAKEQAEAANLAKLHFLNNMRHDIRTPLSCVVGSTRILKQMEDDPDKSEFLDGILKSSENLLQMLTNMLEFNHIQSEERAIEYSSVKLVNLVQDLIDMLQLNARQKGLALTLEVGDNVPHILRTDAYRIQRVLLNLLNNAVKFTQQGFVKVRISHEGNGLRIDIMDSGIGIPKAQQHSIFDKFVRLSSSDKGLYDGEGLGLAIVKHFVEELNGSITLESEQGQGSTFTLSLPLMIEEEVRHESVTG